MKTYRQGDVLVIEVESIPDKTKPVERDAGRIVLAYGEATGHAHAITAKHAHFLEAPSKRRFLRLVKPVALRHEEHREIKLPAGKYEVRRQRVYTPQGLRNVAD